MRGRSPLPPTIGTLGVVIVDDISHARILLRGVLLHIGVRTIIECASRAQAFEEICRAPPDLVITDWEMPGGSGLQLLQDIRTDPRCPDPTLPVIMLTSHAERGFVAQGRDAGATDFLVKPFTPASLTARLQDLVQRQRANVIAPDYRGPDRRRARRPIFGAERRAPLPPPGVVLMPPDGLLAAKIAANPAAITAATARRIAVLERFHATPTAQPTTARMADIPGAATLAAMIDAALANESGWPHRLPALVAPLESVMRAAGPLLAAPLHRVARQFCTFAADPTRVTADAQLARLLLLTLRAMLRIGGESGAEHTANELAGQVEALAASRAPARA